LIAARIAHPRSHPVIMEWLTVFNDHAIVLRSFCVVTSGYG
jgi:hypothetical protein